MSSCSHPELYAKCSPHALTVGYSHPPLEKRLAATTPSGRITKTTNFLIPDHVVASDLEFPGPLVLPGDDLALDPKYPPQSTRAWTPYNKKMPITRERRTIYVVPPPVATKEVRSVMKNWETPVVPGDSITSDEVISSPRIHDVCDYLRAFYYGMDVKKLEAEYSWQLWDQKMPKGADPSYIGLATPAPSKELIGIRHRPSLDGIARSQLNLNDILDALNDRVPDDAYAIVMLVDHDLYEDEEDDFCCGRAYGASRIAVVSAFRYHPALDDYADIDRAHMWPASHCKDYVQKLCAADKRCKKTKGPCLLSEHPDDSLPAAIKASRGMLEPKTKRDSAGLWFSRVARTVSHELGHCFGLDHCVYYTCVMQGTAGMAEDVRQPPYLCPVCLSKVSRGLFNDAGARTGIDAQRAYIVERYQALVEFCQGWKHVGMFSGYLAWLQGRLNRDESLKTE